jgi:transposase
MSKRRKWSADEKVRIVLAGMQPGVEVSDLCRQEGINPMMYYYWNPMVSTACSTRAAARRLAASSPGEVLKRAAAQCMI